MIITEFPKLYKTTSTGKIQTWKISVEGNEITTVYGLQLGKKQVATEVIAEGKNIGKANETTPDEQAVAEAKSQWEKKVKKGYVQNVEDAAEKKVDTTFIAGGVEPMLAKSYDKDGHKISYPAYVQPKLDGHRCIAIVQDGVCTLWSRTRKRITGVPHIERELEAMFPNENIVLDGELYNHDYRDNFEALTSLIRQATPKPGHEVVQYWLYDVVMDGPFEDRQEKLDEIREIHGRSVIVLNTDEADDVDHMVSIFGIYVEYGFEGLMVRNKNGRYKNGRSADLQKVKLMQDTEFEVIDVTEGRGKMAGRAMFHCITDEGKEFRVKMKGALDDLVHYLDNKDDYIGRQLTVQFQNFSTEGLPRFPVAIRFREDV